MSYTITVRIENKPDLKGKDKKIERRVLTLTKGEMLKNLKKNTPHKTGRARGSWASTRDSPNEVTIKSSVQYMRYLDQGTGIYGPKGTVIHIKGNPFLYWKGADHPVRSVEIKGIKPYKIIQKSITATEERVPEFVERAVNEVSK